jgi:hypothetical protein
MLALQEPASGRGSILSAGFITENKEETIRLYTFIEVSGKTRLHLWDGMKANKTNNTDLIPVFRSQQRMDSYEDGENLPTESSYRDSIQALAGCAARSGSGLESMHGDA